jgi:hypothetical protein
MQKGCSTGIPEFIGSDGSIYLIYLFDRAKPVILGRVGPVLLLAAAD